MKQINCRMTWHFKRTAQWILDGVCIVGILVLSVTYILAPESLESNKHPRWGDSSASTIYWSIIASSIVARLFNRYIKWNWCYELLDEVWLDASNKKLIFREGTIEETIALEDVFDIKIDEDDNSIVHLHLDKKTKFGTNVSFLFHETIRFDENGSPNSEYVKLCEILGAPCPPFPELPEHRYYDS